jgi:hypothetical protein
MSLRGGQVSLGTGVIARETHVIARETHVIARETHVIASGTHVIARSEATKQPRSRAGIVNRQSFTTPRPALTASCRTLSP